MPPKSQDPTPRHSWLVIGAVFLCVAGCVLDFVLVVARYPRTVAIPAEAMRSNVAAVFGVNQTATASSTLPLDTVAYDKKMLQLANLRTMTITTTTRISATSTATTTIKISVTVPSPWPVTTVYPNGGALLPFNRIVAYYGNFYSTQMGVLGEYPEAQVLQMLASATAMWAAADPSTPVIPGIDYIAVSAQASPGFDGMYRARMPASQIEKAIAMANQVNGVVILDIQIGLSTVEQEVPLLAPYLKLPNVNLALDPEFAMHNGERPGTVIGTLDASDINFAAQYLANIVTQNNLPPKILVVHRFTQAMVTNYQNIKPLPQVEIVMDMDGFGFPAKKINTYNTVIAADPVQFTGFKLFYKNDAIPSIAGSDHLMTPSEVLQLSPQPSFIQYQ